jgi:hypothetical protein
MGSCLLFAVAICALPKVIVVASALPPDVRRRLFGCLLFAVHGLLFAVLLFAVCCSLFCCLLFAVYCSLFAVPILTNSL